MPIPANSVMQFLWKGEAFSQVIRHVRTWRLVSGGGGGNQLDHATAFIAAIRRLGAADFTTPYLGCLSSDYNLREYRAQVISPVRGAYAFSVSPAGVFGARGITITGNLQGSIEATTALAGRSQVACYKMGPLATADCALGSVTALWEAQVAPYANTWLLDVTLGGAVPSVWRPCIYHRRTPPLPIPYDDVVDVGHRTEVRVKSTRTLRRGE